MTETEFAERGSSAYTQITFSMFIAGLCTFAQLYFLQPLLPLLSRYFNITPAHCSLVISGATIALAAGLLIGAFVSDRFPRKKLMAGALFISSMLTIVSAVVSNFTWLVVLSALKGFALSGVAAIAMAYIGEEVSPVSLSRSMGLYITGTILGGMLGRVIASLLADWFSWHVVSAIIGCACLVLSIVFSRTLPPSKHFLQKHQSKRDLLFAITSNLRDPVLISLCLFAGLAMGSFVSMYNYLGFRLEAPPFVLPQSLITCIFLMYAAGMGGSFSAGPIAEKQGMPQTLLAMAVLMLGGLLLTWSQYLILIIVGLGIFTFSFFGAHTIASSWAGSRIPANRAAASSLYLLFYYLGSSILGTFSGVVMKNSGWNGILFLLSTTLSIAVTLAIYVRAKRLK